MDCENDGTVRVEGVLAREGVVLNYPKVEYIWVE